MYSRVGIHIDLTHEYHVTLCRRDSFITHRAFCDALAEENNKVNHGLIMNTNNLGTHNQMPDHLISSMPMNTNTSMGIGAAAISEYNNYDPKNPLKSLPEDLVPMPFKSIMNTNLPAGGGMFSSSSGSLFGGPRSVNSSTSSSLQLSSNNSSSSGFNYLQDSKNGCGGSPNVTGSAQMSATALLQKAAQMGATASNTTINSPMMQKSFVTSMAGPENHHLLSTNSINVTRPPYDHHHHFQQVQQPQPHQLQDLHQMVGMHGFTNQLFGDANTTSAAASSAAMSDHMGMFSQVVFNMGSGASHDQNQALLRNLEQQRFGGSGGEGGDMTTLDLLGLGGARPAPQNLHEQHQQRLDLEAMSQPRMPMMNPYHQQQQRSHGDSPVESNPFGM